MFVQCEKILSKVIFSILFERNGGYRIQDTGYRIVSSMVQNKKEPFIIIMLAGLKFDFTSSKNVMQGKAIAVVYTLCTY